ncbi:MAG: GntR family transcriptional regulator [Anaerolineae bacterium]
MPRAKPPGADETSKRLIYQEVRRSIIMGRCQPGERLDLNGLGRQYGTSVTPVREALQMLAQEGLVTVRPRSGYFVTQITLKQLGDLLDLREILEVAAVERAATRITAEQLAELDRVHAGYTGDDDAAYDRYTEENRRFHCLIAEASGNEALADAVGRLHDRLARFMVLRHAGKTMEESHQRIVEALRSGDADAACQAMRDEVNDSRQTVLARVIEAEGANWHLGGSSDQE